MLVGMVLTQFKNVVTLILLISVLLYRDPQISGEKVYPLYFNTRLVLSALVMVIHVACMVIGYRENKMFRESISEGYRPGEEVETGKLSWAATKEISTKKIKDIHEPTVVELTKENVWEYLAIDYIKGSVGINENDDRLSFPGGQFVLRENVFLWKYSLKKM